MQTKPSVHWSAGGDQLSTTVLLKKPLDGVIEDNLAEIFNLTSAFVVLLTPYPAHRWLS